MGFYSVLFIGIVFCPWCYSFFDWFHWKQTDPFPRTNAPLLSIPFEELEPEDKFLVEASKITGLKLSQLDTCQHKLIMKIKSSCGKLSDEELSKLAVNLLNCQSDTEGRRIFPCTEEMSLRDCTREMDPETWNAYHVICNRARAVCYASRQEQFRALAEITVNKLVSTAQIHLEQLTLLNANQEKLQMATDLALDGISRSQHDVLSMYSRLRRLESQFATSLAKDKMEMEELGALIDNEKIKISQTLTDFKNFLEETGKELNNQKLLLTLEHKKVLSDLVLSHNLSQAIIKLLGDAHLQSEQNFLKVSSNFNDSFKLFLKMNGSLTEIYSRLNTLEEITTNKTTLILSFIGKSGENVDSALTFVSHFGCLVFSMIICSFLNLPSYLRAVDLSAGFINGYLSLSASEYSVQLPILYSTLALLVIVHFISVFISRRVLSIRKTAGSRMPSKNGILSKGLQSNGILSNRTPANISEWLTDKASERLRNGMLDTPISLEQHITGLNTFQKLHNRTSVAMNDDDNESVLSKVSLRSRRSVESNTSFAESNSSRRNRTFCSTIRSNGLKCKLHALPGELHCRFHMSR